MSREIDQIYPIEDLDKCLLNIIFFHLDDTFRPVTDAAWVFERLLDRTYEVFNK